MQVRTAPDDEQPPGAAGATGAAALQASAMPARKCWSAGFVPRPVLPPPQLVGTDFGVELVDRALRRRPFLWGRTEPQDKAQPQGQPQRPLTPVRFASHAHPKCRGGLPLVGEAAPVPAAQASREYESACWTKSRNCLTSYDAL